MSIDMANEEEEDKEAGTVGLSSHNDYIILIVIKLTFNWSLLFFFIC